MKNDSIRFKIDPRLVSPEKAARRLGLTSFAFEKIRPKLETAGFPTPIQIIVNYNLDAIDAWICAQAERPGQLKSDRGRAQMRQTLAPMRDQALSSNGETVQPPQRSENPTVKTSTRNQPSYYYDLSPAELPSMTPDDVETYAARKTALWEAYMLTRPLGKLEKALIAHMGRDPGAAHALDAMKGASSGTVQKLKARGLISIDDGMSLMQLTALGTSEHQRLMGKSDDQR